MQCRRLRVAWDSLCQAASAAACEYAAAKGTSSAGRVAAVAAALPREDTRVVAVARLTIEAKGVSLFGVSASAAPSANPAALLGATFTIGAGPNAPFALVHYPGLRHARKWAEHQIAALHQHESEFSVGGVDMGAHSDAALEPSTGTSSSTRAC